MRAVWLDVPETFLAERSRLGHDGKDELWDGELHMVPPPSSRHQRVSTDLIVALAPIARRRGLQFWSDHTGLFGPGENWRIPDAMLSRHDQTSERGLEGAELVIEVLSPNDESRQKLPWYASIGVREVWLVEPKTRAIEILVLRDGEYLLANNESALLVGVRFEIVAGPLLRMYDGDSFTDI